MTKTQNVSADERHPNPIDLYVGTKIRARRKVLGISQEKLADSLGLTFQQVQKYERGANRVSASKLYETAKTLQVSVSHFFPPEDATEAPNDDIYTQFIAEGGLVVAEDFVHCDRVGRQAVSNLAKTLAKPAGTIAA